jgi:hypothetical protein
VGLFAHNTDGGNGTRNAALIRVTTPLARGKLRASARKGQPA